jgi:hypothetical protein
LYRKQPISNTDSSVRAKADREVEEDLIDFTGSKDLADWLLQKGHLV